MAQKPKFEDYRHIGIVGVLDKTDDNVWYIDIDGDAYELEDILSRMAGNIVEIKCDM